MPSRVATEEVDQKAIVSFHAGVSVWWAVKSRYKASRAGSLLQPARLFFGKERFTIHLRFKAGNIKFRELPKSDGKKNCKIENMTVPEAAKR